MHPNVFKAYKKQNLNIVCEFVGKTSFFFNGILLRKEYNNIMTSYRPPCK